MIEVAKIIGAVLLVIVAFYGVVTGAFRCSRLDQKPRPPKRGHS